jgi:putative peptidoglycan lipid II flippase
MYLRAGVLSLGLLLLSRVLGLLRESAQAAAFGSTGVGDAVIVMFTLPDLLVGMVFSGALSYVLLPLWALQSPVEQQHSQNKVAYTLSAVGVLLGGVIWLLRDALVQALAPGLQGALKTLGADSLLWSAAALPLAMLAALWATRLQHERDFVGMYAGSLLVNAALVAGVLVVARMGWSASALAVLGGALLVGGAMRLAWLYVRLPKAVPLPSPAPSTVGIGLPGASIWLWAALSSGLLLLLPLMARSLASTSGEGALANFNYAWKLVELPLVLAIQLVASLAFPAITRTEPDSAERAQALQMAFVLAWALACAATAAVATFALPLAQLLFGWGRMSAGNLEVIAQWSAVGVWSLLPQALIAVLLTVMATRQQMHVAVWAYAAGALALGAAGWAGLASGAAVMLALDAVLAGVALILLVSQRKNIQGALHWPALLIPLGVCVLLVLTKPWVTGVGMGGLPLAVLFALAVLGSALLSSPSLKARIGLFRLFARFSGPNSKP